MESLIFFGKPRNDQAIEFKEGKINNFTFLDFHPSFQVPQKCIIFRQYYSSGFWFLQAYDNAQAYTASRIGNDIGVAIKSNRHIIISKSNLQSLLSILTEFKEMALDYNGKYKSDDILNDVKKVISTKLSSVKLSIGLNDVQPKKSKAILFIDKFNENIYDIPSVVSNYTDLYITSNNQLHLFGLNQPKFTDFGNQYLTFDKNGNLIQYNKIVESEINKGKDEVEEKKSNNTWKFLDNQILEPMVSKSEYNQLFLEYRRFKDSAQKNIRIASILATVFFLSTLALLLKNTFFDSKEENSSHNIKSAQNNKSQNVQVVPKNNEYSVPISLNEILINENKREVLNTLIQNIKKYPSTTDKLKYSKAINRDAISLGLDTNKLNLYLDSLKLIKLSIAPPIENPISKKIEKAQKTVKKVIKETRNNKKVKKDAVESNGSKSKEEEVKKVEQNP